MSLTHHMVSTLEGVVYAEKTGAPLHPQQVPTGTRRALVKRGLLDVERSEVRATPAGLYVVQAVGLGRREGRAQR